MEESYRITSDRIGGRFPRGSIHSFTGRHLRALEESTGLPREEFCCPLRVPESLVERRERLAREEENKPFMQKLREMAGYDSAQ